MEIIITDLTRFSRPQTVCIAGINAITGECIRPLPYILYERCKELNILPGSKLIGDFTQNNHRGNPHIEDSNYENLNYIGQSTSNEFYEALNQSLFNSISQGFGYPFVEGGKVIPYTNPPQHSIITLRVSSSQIKVVKDSYNEGKIKLNFQDNDGKKYSYLPITDLGFYNYAMKHFDDEGFPNNLNSFISSQDELYLRIGLSGRYKSPDGKDGYWLQVNGIYTFPNYDTEIRSYS